MTPTVTLVTGTRKGIGRALVEHYVAKGHIVIGCSRTPVEWQLEGYTHHIADVSVESSVLPMFASIRREHGRLDVVINNAGIASMNHSLLTTVATMRSLLDTNLVGTFLVCREAAKLMRKSGGGRIVNFSSIAVPLQLEGEAAYVAAKAGTAALTQVLAKELAPHNITVNTVGPTPIETDLIRGVPKDKIDQIIAQQSIPRMGRMADVIHAVEFFTSPASDFITGQTLYLGGVS